MNTTQDIKFKAGDLIQCQNPNGELVGHPFIANETNAMFQDGRFKKINTQDISKQDESLEDGFKKWAETENEGRFSIAQWNMFEKGGNWQKEKDKQTIDKLVEALNKAGTLLDFVINATETGTNRNHLTDANIYIKSTLEQLK